MVRKNRHQRPTRVIPVTPISAQHSPRLETALAFGKPRSCRDQAITRVRPARPRRCGSDRRGGLNEIEHDHSSTTPSIVLVYARPIDPSRMARSKVMVERNIKWWSRWVLAMAGFTNRVRYQFCRSVQLITTSSNFVTLATSFRARLLLLIKSNLSGVEEPWKPANRSNSLAGTESPSHQSASSNVDPGRLTLKTMGIPSAWGAGRHPSTVGLPLNSPRNLTFD